MSTSSQTSPTLSPKRDPESIKLQRQRSRSHNEESDLKTNIANKLSPKSKAIKKTPHTKKYKLRIEGHRGAGKLENENSLKAFQKAIELDIDGVELDVWLSQDRVPMVIHGHTNEGGLHTEMYNGMIFDAPSEFLRTVKLPNGEHILTFEEVLKHMLGKMSINIELKGKDLELVERVIDILDKYNAFEQINFSAFYHPFAVHAVNYMKAKGIEYKVPFGYLCHLLEEIPEFDKLNIVPNDTYTMDFMLMEGEHVNAFKASIERAKEKKMKVSFYFPIKEEENNERYNKLLEYGANIAITNYPNKLTEFLQNLESQSNPTEQCEEQRTRSKTQTFEYMY
eukprot:TRINITY_DN987_c0_g1_i6.p1 TRINITY_DN987_c0_g1~~TRINITY_DN987_c0_g1_i6.p1  ORF type:complete len:338 (-),score=76.42 TRINITY_DN987_c0_g1_i6:330-1343(-)